MRVSQSILFAVVGAVTMKVFGTSTYVAVPVRRLWTDFSVVSFEGYAVRCLSVREFLLRCIFLPPVPWRSCIELPTGVIDEIDATVLILFLVQGVSFQRCFLATRFHLRSVRTARSIVPIERRRSAVMLSLLP